MLTISLGLAWTMNVSSCDTWWEFDHHPSSPMIRVPNNGTPAESIRQTNWTFTPPNRDFRHRMENL
jgi:hypothetical protein